MLMMASETLLVPADRHTEVRAHVSELIEQTETSNLPASEKASVIGSLRWLLQESISQAGRKLASSLDTDTR
jgi:hypothetical protein